MPISLSIDLSIDLSSIPLSIHLSIYVSVDLYLFTGFIVGVAQVAECLPSKCEAFSSNPSAAKQTLYSPNQVAGSQSVLSHFPWKLWKPRDIKNVVELDTGGSHL
jgi:hypothetical protein